MKTAREEMTNTMIFAVREILHFLAFETSASLLIIFCNFYCHGHQSRVLCWTVSQGDSKLDFTNCPFVSDEIDKIGSQYRCDFSNGTCNWAPSIGKMKWIEAQVRDSSLGNFIATLKAKILFAKSISKVTQKVAMMFPWITLTFLNLRSWIGRRKRTGEQSTTWRWTCPGTSATTWSLWDSWGPRPCLHLPTTTMTPARQKPSSPAASGSTSRLRAMWTGWTCSRLRWWRTFLSPRYDKSNAFILYHLIKKKSEHWFLTRQNRIEMKKLMLSIHIFVRIQKQWTLIAKKYQK